MPFRERLYVTMYNIEKIKIQSMSLNFFWMRSINFLIESVPRKLVFVPRDNSIYTEKISIYRIVSETSPEADTKKEYLQRPHPLKKKLRDFIQKNFKLRDRILNAPCIYSFAFFNWDYKLYHHTESWCEFLGVSCLWVGTCIYRV